MSETFLHTKLFVPALRPSLVQRPQLLEKLNTGLHSKLTLVSAPPGFGKTTLVSSWLHQCKWPFTWLSLDKEDNEPNHFLIYFIAALQEIDETLGKSAVPLLQSSQPPPLEAIFTLLINDLIALPQSIILVLEDYHVIQNLDIHKALAFLLDNLPPQLHLVVTGREDPPLPLHQLRSSGQMNGVYAHDLRFSQDEAAEFLQQTMGVRLDSEDVAALARRTEGWVAGLQLAALSLQSLPNAHQFVTDFAGDDRYIADYLMNEVLSRQPAHIQEFLVQTVVLDRFCPSLCDAILGTTTNHSQAILAYLEDANLFIVPLDNRRQWYRYHHLFADFLRLRLHSELANEVPVLHQRAAAWYEDNGLLAEAIENALSGEDYERASRLIEQNGMATIFGLAQWATLLGWLKALPPEMVQARPELNLHFAWALFSTGQWPATEPYLKELELALGSGQEIEDQKWMLGEAAAIRALVAYEMGDLARSKEMAALAHELLPESNKTIRSVVTLAEGMAHMWGDADLQTKDQNLQRAQDMAREAGNVTVGLFALDCRTILAVRAGRLQQAARLYQQTRALGTVEDRILLGPAGCACVQMGEVLREWNSLAEAEEVLWEGIKLCQRQSGMPVWIIEGHVNLARLKLATGDEQQAEKLMQQAESLLTELPRHGETVGHLISATQAYRLKYWLAQGKLDLAARWLASNGITLDSTLSTKNGTFHSLLVRILIKQGQLAEAQEHLQRLGAVLTEGESLRLSLEHALLQALCLQARGKRNEAVRALSRALQLAEPEGYQRIFLDDGENLAVLLAEVKGRGTTAIYVQKLRSSIQGVVQQAAPSRELVATTYTHYAVRVDETEPLTDRELQILRFMATGLSNKEIAAELYLSINTIKTYTARIYQKFGVHSRAEAVNLAHKRGQL